MQLKYKRYTGSKGMLVSKQTYCVEAMLLANAEEQERINAAGRWDARVWIMGDHSHDADHEELDRQITKIGMRDLIQGVRFEYTNFNNVLRTENVIAEACKQLLATVNCLATFDGTERVVEVDEYTAEVVVTG